MVTKEQHAAAVEAFNSKDVNGWDNRMDAAIDAVLAMQAQAPDVRRAILREAAEANCRWCAGADGPRWDKVPDGGRHRSKDGSGFGCQSLSILKLLDQCSAPAPTERAGEEASDAEPKLEIDRLRSLCGAAYQIAGAIDGPVRLLDALSNAANGEPFDLVHLLPFSPDESDTAREPKNGYSGLPASVLKCRSCQTTTATTAPYLVCGECGAMLVDGGTVSAPASNAILHTYVSTACQHGLHDRCRRNCKFCDVACGCTCGHPAPASAAAASPAGVAETSLLTQAIEAAREAGVRADGFTADNLAVTVTAAVQVLNDAWEKAIQDEGDRISWQGIGAETTFAQAVRARVLAPAPKTPEERVTVTHAGGASTVRLDHVWQMSFGCEDALIRERDAERYRRGTIEELKSAH